MGFRRVLSSYIVQGMASVVGTSLLIWVDIPYTGHFLGRVGLTEVAFARHVQRGLGFTVLRV